MIGFNGNNNFMNNNPMAYQAFLNMMQMNPNFNQNNQMNINNLILQYMMMNNQFIQNPFQQINIGGNFNQQQIIQNGGVLPRKEQLNYLNANKDSFPGYVGERINIVFETGIGITINIATPINVTVKDLLIKFTERVGVSPLLINKKLFFVVNGSTIDSQEQKTVGAYFKDSRTNALKFQVKIVVLDASNVVGA